MDYLKTETWRDIAPSLKSKVIFAVVTHNEGVADANYEADNEEVEESIEVEEATITVTNFTGKAPAGIKMKKIGSGRYGGDDVTMTGDDKKLIAYAVRSLGVDKNKVKDIKSLQKEIDANG